METEISDFAHQVGEQNETEKRLTKLKKGDAGTKEGKKKFSMFKKGK